MVKRFRFPLWEVVPLNRDHLTPQTLVRFHRPIGFFALVLVCLGALWGLRGSPDIASYAAGAGAIVLAPLIAWRRRGVVRIALWTVASLLAVFALASAETAVLKRPHVEIDGRSSRLVVPDPLLGYRPRPNSRATLSLGHSGKGAFRAVYTIDRDGFRQTSGAQSGDADTTVFLGDSYTFGDALNDQDALPQQYSAAKRFRDRVLNTAFSGYGTHQVLRLLQSHRLDRRLGAGRRTFIYLVIDEHLRRIEGRAPTDWLGTPHFALAGPSVRYVGRYHSGLGPVARLLAESVLPVAVGNALMIEPKAQSTELFGAMLQEAQRIVQQRYRGRLLILLWDEPLLLDKGAPGRGQRRAALTDRMAQELAGRGVPYVRVSQLIPDYPAHMSDYAIAGNGHPTAALNRRLALALAQRP